jgi:hypothetical protein
MAFLSVATFASYFAPGGLESQCRKAKSEERRSKKKRLAIFPSPAGMSLTKLFLARNDYIIPRHGEFG